MYFRSHYKETRYDSKKWKSSIINLMTEIFGLRLDQFQCIQPRKRDAEGDNALRNRDKYCRKLKRRVYLEPYNRCTSAKHIFDDVWLSFGEFLQ